MLTPLSDILLILEKYKYFVIFPIVIVEGPIIIIISGFLVYLGYLNVFVAYPVLVIGDLVGDALHYTIGKYWKKALWIRKYGHFLGYTDKSEKFLENHFKNHKIKTFLLAKFCHGLGRLAQVAAGIADVDFFEFIEINLIGTMPKTLLLLVVGFYLGGSYLQIDSYLKLTAFIVIGMVLFLLICVLSNKYISNYIKKS